MTRARPHLSDARALKMVRAWRARGMSWGDVRKRANLFRFNWWRLESLIERVLEEERAAAQARQAPIHRVALSLMARGLSRAEAYHEARRFIEKKGSRS